MRSRRPTLSLRKLALISTAVFSSCTSPAEVSTSTNNTNDTTEPAAPSLAERVLLPAPAFAAGPKGVVIADIAEESVGSVVNISTEKVVQRRQGRTPLDDPFFRQFFGDRFRQMPRERRESSLGSGVIVSTEGVILTNNHVVEGASEIRVTLADGRELQASIVGTDPETDVGVLQLEDAPKDLTALRFGDSESLRLGDIVLAVGNPFGVGQTVTMGIVSATGRANVGIVDYEDFIQTDAAINPGNSGGALVNTRGELVGINTAILSRSGGYQGIGFAIPSNMARRIMDSLVNTGRVSRGFLGISIQDVDKNLADALGLQDSRGVLVGGVGPGSPAEQGGVKRGDVILSVNGDSVASTGQLRNLVALAGASAEVVLEVVRGTERKALKVRLGERPGDKTTETPAERAEPGEDSAGLRLAQIDDRVRQRFRLPDTVDGVLVADVERSSSAARAGFRPGDVILEINRAPIRSVSQVRELFRQNTGKAIPVLVQRGELTQFLALSL